MLAKPQHITLSAYFILCAVLIYLSSGAYFYNYFATQFPGIDYTSFRPFIPGIEFIAAYIWYELYWGKERLPVQFIHEVILLFIMYLAIGYLVTSIQYTPFKPIDYTLVKIERFFHFHLESIIAWTNQQPPLKFILAKSYESLTLQLIFVPLGALVVGRYAYVREYCYLQIAVSIIGGGFYYFFPTTGPASVLDTHLFHEVQAFTGVKFWQIHHYIQPTDSAGGMIAMPSFHVIWAILCVYLVRYNKPFFYLLLINNTIMILACVLLGWHYLIDIFGSILTVITAYVIYKKYSLYHISLFSKYQARLLNFLT